MMGVDKYVLLFKIRVSQAELFYRFRIVSQIGPILFSLSSELSSDDESDE